MYIYIYIYIHTVFRIRASPAICVLRPSPGPYFRRDFPLFPEIASSLYSEFFHCSVFLIVMIFVVLCFLLFGDRQQVLGTFASKPTTPNN